MCTNVSVYTLTTSLFMTLQVEKERVIILVFLACLRTLCDNIWFFFFTTVKFVDMDLLLLLLYVCWLYVCWLAVMRKRKISLSTRAQLVVRKTHGILSIHHWCWNHTGW